MTFNNNVYRPIKEKRNLPVSSRKPVKRKPKDKPKRPLSAYNFFFSDERSRIVAVVENAASINGSDLTEEELSKLRKENGKVSFEEMGKIIGHRWRKIDEGRKEYYSRLAEGSAEQYKIAVKNYKVKQELREKSECQETGYNPNMSVMMEHGDVHVPSGYPPYMGYATYPMTMNQNVPPHYPHTFGRHNPYYVPSKPLPHPRGQSNNSYYPIPGNYNDGMAHQSR